MDTDCDGDVDQDDFGDFQRCFTGGQSPLPAPGCMCFDHGSDAPGGDDDIDAFDFASFELCAGGPTVPANPACDDPP